MQYMTFNCSCSYAGVSNLLLLRGIEIDDRTLALNMDLPWLFSYEDGRYLSGPMLQTAKWFDLALRPMGLRLSETALPAAQVPSFLLEHGPAMLGVRVSPSDKHAIVYVDGTDSELHFWNNKWENDPAEERLTLTPAQLVEQIDSPCVVAVLEEAPPQKTDLAPLLQQSLTVLKDNLQEIVRVCRQVRTVTQLRGSLNSLFRPLFLDGITMLRLAGEHGLADRFTLHQASLLTALRNPPETRLRLEDHIDLTALERDTDAYAALISAKISSATCG